MIDQCGHHTALESESVATPYGAISRRQIPTASARTKDRFKPLAFVQNQTGADTQEHERRPGLSRDSAGLRRLFRICPDLLLLSVKVEVT